MAHYAWSPIRFDSKVDKESGAVLETSTVEVGESVTAGKLNISEEDFARLVESGAVREEKYPEAAKADNLPPQQVMVEEANAALLAAEAGMAAPEPEEESGKAASASKS
jgi:hypothetical protein